MYSKVLCVMMCYTISLGICSQNFTEKLIVTCSDYPPNICGPNARCNDPNMNSQDYLLYRGAFCECRFGTFGTPPNCRSNCIDECEKGHYCDPNKKLCVRGCKMSSDCDDNEICRSKTCRKGCFLDKSCTSEEYCDKTAHLCTKGCQSHQSCELGYYCNEDIRECTQGCWSNDGCNGTEFCDFDTNACKNKTERSKYIECQDHEDCLIDQFCLFSKCQQGCKDHNSCNSDEYCTWFHNCEKGCRDDMNCDFGMYCNLGNRSCTEGCLNHKNCASDEYCTDYKCEYGCSDDSSCQIGEYCDIKKSVYGMKFTRTFIEQSNNSSKPNKRCGLISNKCKKGCHGHSACNLDEYCSKNRTCIKGCRDDKSCNSDEYCDHENKECKTGCMSDKNCKLGEYCNVVTRECASGCRYPYETCNNKEICDSKSHQCRKGCWKNSDCELDEYCKNKKCKKLCTNSTCGPNSICNGTWHTQICSCLDGFVLKRNYGCRLIDEENKIPEMSLDCSNCGRNSKCIVIRHQVHCYCPKPMISSSSNPFLYCPYTGEESAIMKPTDESEISLKSMMTLSRG